LSERSLSAPSSPLSAPSMTAALPHNAISSAVTAAMSAVFRVLSLTPWSVLFACLALIVCGTANGDESVRFNRDVRPILANHCWQCHGFDERARKGGLRLDQPGSHIGESGHAAIVAGQSADSELFRRITTGDPDLRMPPAEHHAPLSADQIDLLRRWIEEGAHYEKHWSLVPPQKSPLPDESNELHPIDAFVQAALKRQGFDFAPEASRETLLRRVTLDLTGLPPSTEDLERTDETYEQTVDRLLNSPHFGEHLAVDWLDAARYADTNGYFSDKPRQMWLWRNWVIDAFNQNMPFDQFTIEQLAGDLLPEPTVQQRIATGFNRNHVANNETGIIDEEFRTEYVVDRVDATATTWLGLTIGCAQCHDHKYDPISQREYYQLFALFNNVPEKGLIVTDNPPPVMTVSSPAQDAELSRLTAATAQANQEFQAIRPQLDSDIATWEASVASSVPLPPDQQLIHHESFDGTFSSASKPVGTPQKFQAGIRDQAATFDATQHAELAADGFDADQPWTIGFWILPDGSLSCPLSRIEAEGHRRGLEFLWQKGRLAVNLVSEWGVDAIELTTSTPAASGQWHHVAVTFAGQDADGTVAAQRVRIFIDGVEAETSVRRNSLTGTLQNSRPFLIARRDSGLGYYGSLDELRILQCDLSAKQIAEWFRVERIRGIVERSKESRSGRDSDFLLDDFIAHQSTEHIRILRQNLKHAQAAEQSFRQSIPTTLVMEELAEPRATHVLNRGQYDKPGERVDPGIPASLGSWTSDAPRNRLGFARWLVSPDNPLTSRVAVNRLWKLCFGEGLVRTANDFGTQGETPAHPDLLDWLAVHFQETGWDTKALLRLIVTSRVYRQDSAFRLQRGDVADQQNHWFVRGPSYRMSAEMIRDHALAVSGLLKPQIGGPSVKPYQPDGLWEEVSYNAEDSYEPDTGDGLWRRSIYTYIKRQSPPPALLLFDGNTREKCTVQRARTNTPLQALNLLNDPTYAEAARSLAIVTLDQNGSDEFRMGSLFQRVLTRSPEAFEIRQLAELLQRQRTRFASQPAASEALLYVGASRIPDAKRKRDGAAEIAAWTVVAQTLLNLDEAITRR
jgi:hypothetical protein